MADEIQINANDLLSGFAVENAQLIQRVVLADLRIRALEKALAETRQELEQAQRELVSERSLADHEADLSRTRDVPLPLDT